MSAAPRMPGLDALRGLAALGVLFWHYGAHFGATPLAEGLRPFYAAGLYLVDVFFVLSGFLLGTLYVGQTTWRGFLLKRVARLFPLHWITLVVVALLQYGYFARTGGFFIYQGNDVAHFLMNLGLVQYVGLQTAFSFNGPAWSISVEWLANLVFVALLLVPVFHRSLSVALVCVSAAGLWFLNGHLIEAGALWGWLDAAVLRGVFGFFVGVCLASVPAGKGTGSKTWDGLGVLACAGLLAFMSHPDWQRVPGLDFAMVGVLVPVLIGACSRGVALIRLTQWRGLIWLGNVSFSVYLWHFPIQIGFALVVAYGLQVPYESPWVLVLFIGLCYGVSHMSWVVLEKPAQRWVMGGRLGRWLSR